MRTTPMAVAILLTAFATQAHADEAARAIRDGLDDALARGRALLDPAGLARPLPAEPAMTDLLDTLAPDHRPGFTPVPAAAIAPPPRHLLLLSAALPGDALRSALAAAVTHRLAVRFKGLLPGEDLVGFARRLHELSEGLEPKPDIGVDPRPFKEHGIDVAPTLVDTMTGAFLRGAIDPRDLERRNAPARRPDLGRHGSTVAVVERDLLEVIQERLAAMDLGARAEAARDRYGERLVTARLPRASEDRVRLVDPTMHLRAPLQVGAQVYPAGYPLNPLDALPLDLVVVAIDATDPAQVAFAARHVADRVVTTIVSDRLASWREHVEAEQALRRRIHLLTPEIARRLGLEAVPAVVTVTGNRLQVTETALEEHQ